jgi:phospholipase C
MQRRNLLVSVDAPAAAIGLSGAAKMANASVASSGGSSTITSPIQRVLVIYQENVSFDHYFGNGNGDTTAGSLSSMADWSDSSPRTVYINHNSGDVTNRRRA